MTTLIPRQPYSQDELEKLYPKELELQLVQIVSCILCFLFLYLTNYKYSYCGMVRFSTMVQSLCAPMLTVVGERSPVSPRFQNVDKPLVQHIIQVLMIPPDRSSAM